MASRKQKRSQKRRNTSKRRRSTRTRRQRGGCASCGSSLSGGGVSDPSFQGLPQRYYYEVNDLNADPNNPSAIVNPRLTGGRKNRRRKQKGGSSIPVPTDYLLGTASYNLPAAMATSAGAPLSYSFLSGDMNGQNPSTTVQPVEAKYNENNQPMA
jgi:hypothetical protein